MTQNQIYTRDILRITDFSAVLNESPIKLSVNCIKAEMSLDSHEENKDIYTVVNDETDTFFISLSIFNESVDLIFSNPPLLLSGCCRGEAVEHLFLLVETRRAEAASL